MPPDDDIEFDFFDEEPVTAEAPESQSRVRLPRRRSREPRDPGRGPAAHADAGDPPRCARLHRDLHRARLLAPDRVLRRPVEARPVRELHGQGRDDRDPVGDRRRQTVTVLTSPGLDAAAIVKRLNNIAAAEQQNVVAAQELSPPGKLRLEHGNLIQSLTAAGERCQRPVEGVREDDRLEVEDRDRGRRAEPAGLPSARQRHRLGRPVPDAVGAGARGRGRPRRQGAVLALPARARPDRLAARDGADPPANRLGRGRRRDAGRPARHEHRLHGGAPERRRRRPPRC